MLKSYRILNIYDKLLNNQNINIEQIALEEKTSQRTIERDISEIRDFLLSKNEGEELIYDKKNKNYFLKNSSSQKFTKSETLAIKYPYNNN